jgi:hypothetical protein
MIPVAFVTLLVPAVVLAGSGERGIDGVVRAIESRYHVRATKLPFMGLISLVAGRATHEGVNRVRVVEIDSFPGPVDGDELNRIVTEKLGAGWERIIRDTSRKGNEQTLIYAHPEDERIGLMIVDLDGSEMDLVEVSVDPRHLNDEIGKYHHHHDEREEGESD